MKLFYCVANRIGFFIFLLLMDLLGFEISFAEEHQKEISIDIGLAPKDNLSLIFINPRKMPDNGKFLMGTSDKDMVVIGKFGTSHFDEQSHIVQLGGKYYLGKFEVTRAQFKQFLAKTGYKVESDITGCIFGLDQGKGVFAKDKKFNWNNTGFPQEDDHPVVGITYHDATMFCEWLNNDEQISKAISKSLPSYEAKCWKCRLPTEARWEYACRAGESGFFSFGNDERELCKYGNAADRSARDVLKSWETTEDKDGYAFTSPVGKFLPNKFGLYDMHGNAMEWCLDYFEKDYEKVRARFDPKNIQLNDNEYRVIRGGSCFHAADPARSAARARIAGTVGLVSLGFRISIDFD